MHRKEDFYKKFLRKDKTPGVGLYGENPNIHEGTKTDLETKIQFERFQSVYAPSNSNEVVKKRIFFLLFTLENVISVYWLHSKFDAYILESQEKKNKEKYSF